jgi:hypothetical protein
MIILNKFQISGIIVALTVPTLIGTFYIHRASEKKKQKTLKEEEEVMTDLNHNKETDNETVKTPVYTNVNLKFWKGVCLQENFKAIMSTEVSSSSLPSLNGFRGIGVSRKLTGF